MLVVVAVLIVLAMPSAGWAQDTKDKQRIMELLNRTPKRQVGGTVAAALALRNCIQTAWKGPISNNPEVTNFYIFRQPANWPKSRK